MEQKHLQRAQQIVDGIAACNNALSFESPAYQQSNHLAVTKPRPGSTQPHFEQVVMSRAVREAAFRVWRRETELRLAALRREAAQIGLKLED